MNLHPRHHVGQGIADAVGNLSPSNVGQSIADFISGAGSTLSNTASAADAASSVYQNQTQAMKDYLAQQQAIANQNASQASSQAAGAASNLGMIIVSSVAILALVLILTRK